jgi:hypothetical protein
VAITATGAAHQVGCQRRQLIAPRTRIWNVRILARRLVLLWAVVGDLIGSGDTKERGVVGETENLAARSAQQQHEGHAQRGAHIGDTHRHTNSS